MYGQFYVISFWCAFDFTLWFYDEFCNRILDTLGHCNWYSRPFFTTSLRSSICFYKRSHLLQEPPVQEEGKIGPPGNPSNQVPTPGGYLRQRNSLPWQHLFWEQPAHWGAKRDPMQSQVACICLSTAFPSGGPLLRRAVPVRGAPGSRAPRELLLVGAPVLDPHQGWDEASVEHLAAKRAGHGVPVQRPAAGHVPGHVVWFSCCSARGNGRFSSPSNFSPSHIQSKTLNNFPKIMPKSNRWVVAFLCWLVACSCFSLPCRSWEKQGETKTQVTCRHHACLQGCPSKRGWDVVKHLLFILSRAGCDSENHLMTRT